MINVLIDLISGILKGVFGLLWDITQSILNSQPKRKETDDANFLPANALLSTYNKGFSLNGNANLTVKNSHMSAMLLGGSGSGKSVTVAIPSILNLGKHGHSICVHDPSSELFLATAGYLQKKGYKVMQLHYSEPNQSEGYNPLALAKNATDIQKVASLLVRNVLGENSKDPFWSTQSVMLITLMGNVLKKQSFWYQNFVNIKLLIETMVSNPDAIDRLVAGCQDKAILNEYKQFVAMDNKLMVSIISTCRAALSIFNDPALQIITSYESIDFEAFRKEKVALFICNRTADMKFYSALSAIFFEQFFGVLMSRLVSKNEKSVFFILDEASSLYMPTLQIALANLRKYRAGILCIAQDFNQFIHLYGSHEAASIRSNTYSVVHLPGVPISVAKELQAILGNFEFEDKSGHCKTRPLMTADEIRVMKPNTSLIVSGANRAIFTRMYPYFKNPKYRHVTRLSAPKMKADVPFEDIPLIPLPKS